MPVSSPHPLLSLAATASAIPLHLDSVGPGLESCWWLVLGCTVAGAGLYGDQSRGEWKWPIILVIATTELHCTFRMSVVLIYII